jgi:diaminobutyrate-2-oxoglutarate transaminase
LRFVVAEDLAARAAGLGDRLLAALRDLAGEHPMVGDVRGQGLMLGVELVDPAGRPDRRGTPPPAGELAARVRSECLARGLIVELGGRHDSVVRLLPPLTITDEEAATVVDRLADAVAGAEAAAGLAA